MPHVGGFFKAELNTGKINMLQGKIKTICGITETSGSFTKEPNAVSVDTQ